MKQNAPILNIKDLQTWFPIKRGIFSRTVGHVRAVDGVSLNITRGETLGLVGESGCGKTTLARTIMKLDKPRAGSMLFEGRDLMAQDDKTARSLKRKLQMIFQDPFSSLNPRMTVMDIITEGLVEHQMIRSGEKEEKAIGLLNDVGMDKDSLHRYPHEFSGGQRQRISIARAISTKPSLVICDEAVSALDVSVQAQIINLLMNLRDKHRLSYFFITHDLSVVDHIADNTAVMYLGQIIEYGRTEDIIRNPRHPYTKALISAAPRAGEEKTSRQVLQGDVPSPSDPPQGCRFHPRCPFAKNECRQTIPELGPAKDDEEHNRVVACIRKDEI